MVSTRTQGFKAKIGPRFGESMRMRSEEVRKGMRVRVREDHDQPDLRGCAGTVMQVWGNPSYVALDVLFEDGRSELFWHYQLEKEES